MNKEIEIRKTAIDNIAEAQKNLADMLSGDLTEIEKSMHIAYAMETILSSMDAVKSPVMSMVNTHLGFLTDRDPSRNKNCREAYKWEEIKPVVCEALVRGYRLTGNEFNIIAGGFYAAKNGLRRKILSLPHVSNYKTEIGVPRNSGEKGAIVECKATWKHNGVEDSLSCQIPVTVNAYMGVDGVIGKAERKLHKRVLDILEGLRNDIPESDNDDYIDIDTPQNYSSSKPASRTEQLKAKARQKPLSAFDQVLSYADQDGISVTDTLIPWLTRNDPACSKVKSLDEVPESVLKLLVDSWNDIDWSVVKGGEA